MFSVRYTGCVRRRISILAHPFTRWLLTSLCGILVVLWCVNQSHLRGICEVSFGKRETPHVEKVNLLQGEGACVVVVFFTTQSLAEIRSTYSKKYAEMLGSENEDIFFLKNPIPWKPSWSRNQGLYRSFIVMRVPLWIPFLLIAPIAARSWILHRRDWRAARATHCPNCDYSRTGLAASVACPECGATANAMARHVE